MTTKEAAALWGCGWQTVKRLVREGRVEGTYKVGYTWVIPDWALRPPALSRGRTGVGTLRAEEMMKPEPALSREECAARRAQAADKLAEIVLADPGARWARYALEAVLKQLAIQAYYVASYGNTRVDMFEGTRGNVLLQAKAVGLPWHYESYAFHSPVFML